MLTYTIKRLIGIFPTLVLITLLLFILDQIAPGDRVARTLAIEGISPDRYIEQYRITYVNKAKELHFDKAPFYVVMTPQYMPQEIMQIYPLTLRSSIKKLSHRIKNRELAKKYIDLIQQITASGFNENNGQRIWNLILLEDHPDKIRSYIPSISPHVNNHPLLSEWIAVTSTLKLSESTFAVPRFEWHGMNNRFHYFLSQAYHFRENISLVDGRKATVKIGQALKWTISVGLLALLISAVASLILACLMGIYEGHWMVNLILVKLIAVLSMPVFWIATVALVFLTSDLYSSWLHWFPGVSPMIITDETSVWLIWKDFIGKLMLPILVTAIPTAAYLTKLIYTDILKYKRQPYVQAAVSRGLGIIKIMRAYILPNAMLGYLTVLCGAIPGIISGSLVIELIFNIPGVGLLLIRSIEQQEWPVIIPLAMLIAVITIVSYLLSDLLTAYFFPQSQKSFTNA